MTTVCPTTKQRYNRRHRRTVKGFLTETYHYMRKRVLGKVGGNKPYWRGKDLCDRDAFTSWAKNHPDFLPLFRNWLKHDCELRLRPVVNRINPKLGYVLPNMEWITFSANAAAGGRLPKRNSYITQTRQAILNLVKLRDTAQTKPKHKRKKRGKKTK